MNRYFTSTTKSDLGPIKSGRQPDIYSLFPKFFPKSYIEVFTEACWPFSGWLQVNTFLFFSPGMGSETHHICRQCKDFLLQPGSPASLRVWGLSRRREIQSDGSCWTAYQNLSWRGECIKLFKQSQYNSDMLRKAQEGNALKVDLLSALLCKMTKI